MTAALTLAAALITARDALLMDRADAKDDPTLTEIWDELIDYVEDWIASPEGKKS